MTTTSPEVQLLSCIGGRQQSNSRAVRSVRRKRPPWRAPLECEAEELVPRVPPRQLPEQLKVTQLA